MEVAQGLPERVRIADATERHNRTTIDACRLTGGIVHPAGWMCARVEHGSLRIVAGQHPAYRAVVASRLGAGQHEYVGAGQRGQRFAKTSNREQFPSRERVERIDQHNVAVAPEAAMLESIVEDEDVGASELLQPLAGVESIWRDARVGMPFPHEYLCFVAGLIHRNLPPRGNQHCA
jgi:hypothetical protein